MRHAATAVLALLIGCMRGDPSGAHQRTDDAGVPRGDDTLALDEPFRRVMGLVDVNRRCSGALIDPDHVLTAGDCCELDDPAANEFAIPPGEGGTGAQIRRASRVVRLEGGRLAIAALAPAPAALDWLQVRRRAATAELEPMQGKLITCYGAGRGWRLLRRTVNSVHADFLAVDNAADGDAFVPGDSGGLCIRDGEIVAVVTAERRACLDDSTPEACSATTSTTQTILLGTRAWAEHLNALPAASASLQLAVLTPEGEIWHRLRHADGSWSRYVDMARQVWTPSAPSSIGRVRDVELQTNLIGETHILAVGSDGGLFHTMRPPGRGWFTFGDLVYWATDHATFGPVTQASIAEVGVEMHVSMIVRGRFWHTIRRFDGRWSKIQQVPGLARAAGGFTQLATAGEGDQLHVCGLVRGGDLYHAIRRANGTFSDFVPIATGTLAVDCATVSGELHVVRLRKDHELEHRIRHRDGVWTAASVLGASVGAHAVTISDVGGNLHLVIQGGADGRLYHAIWQGVDGAWQSFREIEPDEHLAARFSDLAAD